MKNLEQTRREIDRIDEGLVKLFLERLAVSRDVAMAKLETGGPVSDPAREREILTRVSEAAGPENENAARLFFTTLFSISKARQRGILKGDSPLVREIRGSIAAHANPFPSRAFVACCGTEGSYAQQAATRLVKVPTIMYFNSFEKVFEAVEKGLCAYGVLPVENSAAGSVTAVYDLMQKHSFHIVRAVRLRVDHVLLAPPGVELSDVREVASHPHALAQCTAFFKLQKWRGRVAPPGRLEDGSSCHQGWGQTSRGLHGAGGWEGTNFCSALLPTAPNPDASCGRASGDPPEQSP